MESKIDIDQELKADRLLGWIEVELNDVKVGDHLRVSSNKFHEPGRRCSHVVVQSIQDNIVYVNSYLGHKFKDWALKPDCPYKQQKYYIRPSQKRKHTGLCVKCGTSKVQPPYYKCIFCKNQKRFKGNQE